MGHLDMQLLSPAQIRPGHPGPEWLGGVEGWWWVQQTPLGRLGSAKRLRHELHMADAMVAAWLGKWTVAVGFIGFSAPLQRIGWVRLAGLHSQANDGPIESDHRSLDGVCYPSQFVHGMHKRAHVPQAD